MPLIAQRVRATVHQELAAVRRRTRRCGSFPTARVEVVSLGDECKEVLVYADGTGPAITATALGRGSFTATPAKPAHARTRDRSNRSRYRWLVVPDVALQKARLARLHLRGKADIWSENGYGFAAESGQRG